MANKEYIERDSLLQSKDWLALQVLDRARATAIILGRRAADVVEVRHGKWIIELDDLGWLKHTCSVCGYTKRTDVHTFLDWDFCPRCGAKMDGKGERL